ncbi:universal stress protein [Roseivivax sediminis]|uniref:Nucleotide-binding universal stress protein, UspA family n=1 Tax=Roseivivax sediminis TaxID=936889 RepID=A0A1I1VIN2_9RHOB|nr:universal stress protein [Roseivivax sediminis]SFD82801.1 Nucleotide-binding universal stress protein, UspA family [Roseivivax sediminis]
MKRIMLATDFSERSDRALRRATLLAHRSGASVLILNVVDDDQPSRVINSERKVAAALLGELQGTMRSVDGVSCETRVEIADPFVGIAQVAEEERPDLLVLGPHRRQTLRDVFVGTTAERTIRSVSCPVLMVNAPPMGSYRHVLVATDLSDAAMKMAKSFIALGITGTALTSFGHVYQTPGERLAMSHTVPVDDREAYLEEMRKEAESDLAGFVKTLGSSSERQYVRRGLHAPAEEILTLAREEAADLVVVGTLGRSGLAKFFLGSVAEAVLRAADRDILAIPPESTAGMAT